MWIQKYVLILYSKSCFILCTPYIHIFIYKLHRLGETTATETHYWTPNKSWENEIRSAGPAEFELFLRGTIMCIIFCVRCEKYNSILLYVIIIIAVCTECHRYARIFEFSARNTSWVPYAAVAERPAGPKFSQGSRSKPAAVFRPVYQASDLHIKNSGEKDQKAYGV